MDDLPAVPRPFRPDTVLTFGGSGLDRAAHLRGDPAALSAAQSDPRARVVPLWRGKPLVTGGPDGGCVTGLGWLPVGQPGLEMAGPPIFLGLDDRDDGADDGAPRFACDLSGWTPDTPPDGPLDGFKKGLHDIFGGDIKKAVSRYFELTRMMLDEDCPDIVGHLDKIKMQNSREHFFNETETWYRDELRSTLEAVAESGAVLEVNTRGLYKKKSAELYPGTWALEQALELDIPIMLNSDGHHPSEITAEFATAATILNNVGYTAATIIADGEWQEVGLSPAGLDQ